MSMTTWRPQMPKLSRIKNGILIATAVFLVVAGVVLISTFFVERALENRLAKSVNAALAVAPPQFAISYSRVDVNLWRQSFSLLNVHFQNILIDRIRLWGVDWQSLSKMIETHKAVLPHEIKIEFDGIHISPDFLGEQAAATFLLLGYEKLDVTVFASLALDLAHKNIELREFTLEANHVGRLEAKASIGSFSLPTLDEYARLKQDPRLLITDNTELTKATLKSFEVRYIDDSFIRRITTALVQAGEDTPESLAQLALDVNGASATPANDFTKPALETLLKFVREPRSITLISRPPQPIPFVSLLDERTSSSINELAHRLHLSVK